MSVSASFNDSRCAEQMVCPNDSLLFTCTVTGSPATLSSVLVAPGQVVNIHSGNTTSVGEGGLPDGVIVQSHDVTVDGGLANYTLIIFIQKADSLNGSVICDPKTLQPLTDEAICLVSTGVVIWKHHYSCCHLT